MVGSARKSLYKKFLAAKEFNTPKSSFVSSIST